jgi:hypothetical protein
MIQLTNKYRFLLLLALLSLGKPLATPIADAASGLLTSSHHQQQQEEEHDQASTAPGGRRLLSNIIKMHSCSITHSSCIKWFFYIMTMYF